MLEIFECLAFPELAAVASLSPRNTELILKYIIPSIGIENASLVLKISGLDNIPRAIYPRAGEVGDFKHLCKGDDHVLATLKAFCPVFGELHVMLEYYYAPNSELVLNIIDHINRYCSTVPQKVTIRSGENSLIEEFTMPNVTSVDILFRYQPENFWIATHFPQIESLSIEIDDYFTIIENLPHLKHLTVSDETCSHFDLTAFAEVNPQVRSVKIDLCQGLRSLQELNECFPNLVSLYYRPKEETDTRPPLTDQNGVQSVHFSNVKSYTIDLRDYYRNHWHLDSVIHEINFDRFKAIQFDRLESLEFISVGEFLSITQLDLVLQYKDLKSLDYRYSAVSYEQIWRLVDTMPRLKEIIVKPKGRLTDQEDVLRLMRETNLETIRVFLEEPFLDEFRGLDLPDGWHLDESTVQTVMNTFLFDEFTYKRNGLSQPIYSITL